MIRTPGDRVPAIESVTIVLPLVTYATVDEHMRVWHGGWTDVGAMRRHVLDHQADPRPNYGHTHDDGSAARAVSWESKERAFDER